MSCPTTSHFRTLQQFKSDFSPNDFALYESERTGMRVVVVDQKGPKVYGYFALATEIHDDSGAPHTLEHLVFMGSRSYKYKGLLDKLATRAYSNTNAWTGTDQTVYTLDTAGWEGFAQILPVYLEHVLLPTLTDAGCLTEVYHVDGSGHDAGVVYSEMQGVQNQQDSLMDLQARRLFYPKSVAFRSETGGLMEQLRVLTADRIRSFHKEMYQPKNLCVILIGEVDHPNLLSILGKFEESIQNEVPRLDEPFDRPWMKTGKTTFLKESILDVVEFPEEDESMGEILINFLGPDFKDDLLTDALNVLLVYICGSSVSLLENTLVEKEQLCSAVYYATESRPDTIISFTLSGVGTEKLQFAETRFFEVLTEAVSKPLDMDYLKDCLHRYRLQIIFYSESSGNFFGETIIADHCFGNRDGSTLKQIATLTEFEKLVNWKERDWRDFFSTWIAKANHVSILGVPSRKMAEKIKSEEEARVKAREERLGPEGLAKLAKQLADAKAENDREIPQELIHRFKIPGTESIHFIPTITARSGLARKLGDLHNEVQDHINKDKTDLPLFIHFEHIPTNFIHLHLILCTHSIPEELRPLLPVYLLNFFDTPVLRNGVKLAFEDIVTQLEKDTVAYDIDSGADVGNSELLRIRLQVEPSKYSMAIAWIRDLLLHSIFSAERLQATLAKLLADIADEKRSGSGMATAVMQMASYSRSSTTRAQNTLVKAVYLKRVAALLRKDPDAVIGKFEAIRARLSKPDNFRVLVLANLLSGDLTAPVSSWKVLTSSLPEGPSTTLQPLDRALDTLSPAGRSPGTLATLVTLPIDSSFLILSSLAPTSYSDPSLPSLYVALAYLNAVEGPLWTAVRGTGLAYGASFYKSVDTGRLQFSIYRSPDAAHAYEVARKTVQELADGTTELEESGLEGAVSSCVVGFADEQTTMATAANMSFANVVVRGLDKTWSEELMREVRKVGKEEVKTALREWVCPVFEAGKADLVVTCSGGMTEGLMEKLEKAGFKVEKKTLADVGDDYGFEVGEGLEGLEEDSEDEGDEEEEEDSAEGSSDEDGVEAGAGR